MKYYILIIILLQFSFKSFGQDQILTTNGMTIESIVQEIGLNEVKYKKFDNLNGPTYILAKTDVLKINFQNGTTEILSTESRSEINSIDEIEGIIIEYINKYADTRSGIHSYHASFDDNYLKLSRVRTEEGDLYPDFSLYDFRGKCTFHELSQRKQGVSFINIELNRGYSERRKMKNYKLVIRVDGHDNATVLLNALKNYNEYYYIN